MLDSCTQKEFVTLFFSPKSLSLKSVVFFWHKSLLSSGHVHVSTPVKIEEASLGALDLETAALLPEAVAEGLGGGGEVT